MYKQPIAWVVILVFPFLSCSNRSADELDQALAQITPEAIQSHIRFLSHDLLRGRNTGDVGFEIAKEYVVAQFERIGLRPHSNKSYLQHFELIVGGNDQGSLLELSSLQLQWPDVVFTPDWQGMHKDLVGEGVFVGYGVVGDGRDDYADFDVNGKIVFLIPGIPTSWKGQQNKSLLLRLKNEVALRRGAIAVVMLEVDSGLASWDRRTKRRPMVLADGSAPSLRANAFVGPESSNLILMEWGLDPTTIAQWAEKKHPPKSVGLIRLSRAHDTERSESWNVIGIHRGSDPNLQDEAVVFTAHLDHVGIGEPDENDDRIYNGAHDNALGIGKMLAAAEAITNLRTRRSVIFIATGAEEKGLLGAWYYVKNPTFPIEQTAAAINHDGGRDGPAVEDVLAIGARFSTLEEEIAIVTGLLDMSITQDGLEPLSPSASLLFRSDHYPFLLAGVPAVYLMDGFSVNGNIAEGQRWWTDYLNRFNHKQRDHFREEWTLESAVRMSGLSVRLAQRLTDSDSMPQMKTDSPIAKTRNHPVEPYFFAQDQMER